jgi:hypothetical protein
MINDNVYPLNGRAFRPGLEDLKDKKYQSDEEVLEQLPVLKQMMNRLNGRIDATDSVKQALVIAEQYKLSKDEALAVMDIVRLQLEDDRRYLTSKIRNLK